MKKLVLLTTIIALLFTGCKKDNGTEQQNTKCDFVGFKYYYDEPDDLGEMQNDYILLGIDRKYSDEQIRSFISTVKQFDQDYEYLIHDINYSDVKEIPVKLRTTQTCEQITQLISDLNQKPIILYVHYTMKTDDCVDLIFQKMGDLCVNSYSCFFYVSVFDENDLTALNQTIAETNTELVRQNNHSPKSFTLRATKNSKGDALKMANYFHETGLFEYSEPNIIKYPVEFDLEK